MKFPTLLIACLLALTSCEDNNEDNMANTGTGTGTGSNTGTDTSSSVSDTSQDPAKCFENPQTHYEIINACTTAQGIEKHPLLPLLNADGSLPPLP